jgi:hypothetical protein
MGTAEKSRLNLAETYKRLPRATRMPATKQQKLDALDTEIVRSQNYIKFIESRLTPEQLHAAQRAKIGK